MSKCLVTGGAGFIGSHIVDRLIKDGHDVRVIDNLEFQVHKGKLPSYLNPKAEYDFSRLYNTAIPYDTEYIFHCASKVGVAQSQKEIYEFTKKNILDTSWMLNISDHVKAIIHCGSMAPYGHGTEHEDSPITEGLEFNPLSFYAITKQTQEQMIHLFGELNNIRTVSLRYFSVYGSRQALNNPYAGPIPIFIENAYKNKPLTIFEDGEQTRDFVHVSDVVEANMLAMKSKHTNASYNIGTGKETTIRELAQTIKQLTGSNSEILVTMKHRDGDIRHSLADIWKAKTKLGYNPKVVLKEGLKETIEWYKEESN